MKNDIIFFLNIFNDEFPRNGLRSEYSTTMHQTTLLLSCLQIALLIYIIHLAADVGSVENCQDGVQIVSKLALWRREIIRKSK